MFLMSSSFLKKGNRLKDENLDRVGVSGDENDDDDVIIAAVGMPKVEGVAPASYFPCIGS